MKQKTAAIKFLRTKIAAGYVLILILIFSIVYIWFKEHHKLEEMKEASHKIVDTHKKFPHILIEKRTICTVVQI